MSIEPAPTVCAPRQCRHYRIAILRSFQIEHILCVGLYWHVFDLVRSHQYHFYRTCNADSDSIFLIQNAPAISRRHRISELLVTRKDTNSCPSFLSRQYDRFVARVLYDNTIIWRFLSVRTSFDPFLSRALSVCDFACVNKPC